MATAADQLGVPWDELLGGGSSIASTLHSLAALNSPRAWRAWCSWFLPE